MILNSTQRSLEVLLVTVPGTPWTWTVDFQSIPLVGKPAVPSGNDGTIASAAAVTMIPAPAQNGTAIVTSLSILNADSLAQVVTVRMNNNGSYRNYYQALMNPGDQLTYQTGRGFAVMDASGNSKGISPTTGFVNDSQESYTPSTYQPLSLTPEGEVRVLVSVQKNPWAGIRYPSLTRSPWNC